MEPRIIRFMVSPRRWLIISTFLAGTSPAPSATPLAGNLNLPFLTLSHAAAVDFESGPGSMAVSDIVLTTPLTSPIALHDSLVMIPSLGIRSSVLTFEKIPTSVIDSTPRDLTVFPMAFRLSDALIYQPGASRWTHGLLATGKLASDLREITSEDFGGEFGIFSSYQVSERLSLGGTFGMSISENDNQFRPGLVLDWTIRDDLDLHLAGTNWSLRYAPDDHRSLSLRGYTTNEIWSMLDQAGETLTLKLGSYRVGCFYEQRITESLSLSLGAGCTLNNRMRLDDMFGATVVNAHLDPGPFIEFGLTITTW